MAFPREKIALLVFSALILLGLGGLISYLSLGHSWNVAATTIDDAAGSMEGYTTILYEGTVPEPLPRQEEEAQKAAGAEPSSKGRASTPRDAAQSDESVGDKRAGDSESDLPSAISGDETDTMAASDDESGIGAQNLSDETGLAGDKGSAAETSDASVSDAAPSTPSEELASDPESDDLAKSFPENPDAEDAGSQDTNPLKPGLTLPNAGATTKKPALALVDAEESYREKNATVFSLDIARLARYKEGTILKKGDHRFGVFSVLPTDTAFKIEQMVRYFEKHEVDFLVVLTPDKKIVEKVEGIDIVISTQDEELFIMGETINSTFYVSAPTIGSVGAILISPSNVVSAKVLSEL